MPRPTAMPIIVAEIGINHCGNLRIAKAMIAMAKALGADYVKFQKRTIEKVYSIGALKKAKHTGWGQTKHHEKLGLEFGRAEYDELDAFCRKQEVKWFASPWDADSVDFLVRYNVPFLKVASPCVTHLELLEEIASTQVPSILSVGGATVEEIDAAVKLLDKWGQLKHILHCCYEYPAPDEHMNMLAVKALQERYGERAQIGFSNHNRRVIYMAAAYAMGAGMIEFHIVLDKSFPGDDQMASIGPGGFVKVMEHLECLQAGLGTGVVGEYSGDKGKAGQYAWRAANGKRSSS